MKNFSVHKLDTNICKNFVKEVKKIVKKICKKNRFRRVTTFENAL